MRRHKHLSHFSIPVALVSKLPHYVCQVITIPVYFFRIQLCCIPRGNEEDVFLINHESAPKEPTSSRFVISIIFGHWLQSIKITAESSRRCDSHAHIPHKRLTE
ncbi:hypothetical protein TGAM01_v209108 [Trichoderma gamsii]|uniref:Uncharacterized protein n=1 Tax=Trichoderma gamsii TaxID=398673 RepID=A0A2P4ZCL8_9HYPO|nr:hypothetical protein TGAM01_v209108 [Trichoderma gamsii]PON22038.1 hypothetical protein TGAM01_v209108 [Trichoderma gamsii]